MMVSSNDILNANILIVDDQMTHVLILEGMLRHAGYSSIAFTLNPHAVCELHRKNSYDLILLDLKMPGMDGFQVMEDLREIERHGYLPVLAITTDQDLKLRALQAGAKDFISRPFNLVEVLMRIHNMLEVRLLYTVVENHSKVLEQTVQERTANLRLSEARFRSFTDMSSDWYWEQDDNCRFTMISGEQGKGEKHSEQLLGKTRWELSFRFEEGEWTAHRAALEARQPFTDFEYRTCHENNGCISWHCINGEPLFDVDGTFTGYRGTGKDITQRKQAEERFRQMALHDELTGLPNRTLLQDRLQKAIAHADRDGSAMWVLLIDLDRFKSVNDSLGHKAGDMLLREIAERLQSATRETDTVARLGGDEFAIILSDPTDGGLSTEIVQRIMDSVAQVVTIERHEFFMSCSIGVAIYRAHGTTSEALMEHADIAMYRAKEMGRNNFQFYTSAMNAHLLERLSLEKDLRNAVERQEFLLHYQPQVDLYTGRIIGMEALIRWQHPELGMLPPNRFIGLAEETGLIGPIGTWVVRTACAQTKAWQRAGYGNLHIAVNLSARQFTQQDLVQSMAAILAQTGLEPHFLELELTESLVMADVEQAIGILRDLKALGVQMSIDDFGTGYSSLSYLKRFPIDVLKIDQSFVRDIAVDSDDAAIVKLLISLAHNLKLRVIAEGVETQEQLTYLRSQDCDAMQGHLFSKALSAEAFERILRQGKCLYPEAGSFEAADHIDIECQG